MRRLSRASRAGIGLAVIVVLSACAPGASQSPAPASAATTAAPTAADTADATARQWLAGLQAKDLGAMKALFAPEAVFEDAALGEKFSGGPAAETSGWGPVLSSVVSVKDAKVLALGDGVAVVAYTLYGPTPANSTAVDVPFLGVLRVKDAQITRETIYYSSKLAYGS